MEEGRAYLQYPILYSACQLFVVPLAYMKLTSLQILEAVMKKVANR